MAHKFGIGTGNSVYESTNGTTNTTNTMNQIRGIRNKIRNSYTERAARGFTLVELLVSISIFTIITTAVVVNFRVSERSTELRLAAQGLVTQIRNAQTMALTGQQIDGTIPQGYGVRVTDSGLIFFANADSDGDLSYNEGEGIPDVSFSLPSAVVIDDFSPVSLGTLDIVFETAGQRIWINGAENVGFARIELRHQGTGQTRAIIIRSVSGRIDIE